MGSDGEESWNKLDVGRTAHQPLNQLFAAQEAVPRGSGSISLKSVLVVSGATVVFRKFMAQLQCAGNGGGETCNKAKDVQDK
jgi:hypothetical protein